MSKYLDKIAHCFCCAFLTLALSLFIPVFMAVWAVVVVSIAKELADKYILKGCADWKDLVADVIGIIIGLVTFALK